MQKIALPIKSISPKIWVPIALGLLLFVSLQLLTVSDKVSQTYSLPGYTTLFTTALINIIAIGFVAWLLMKRRAERLLFVGTLTAAIAYTYLYYLRFSGSLFRVLFLQVDSKIIVILTLVALYTITIYYLLRKDILPFFLRAALAFLILIATFSFFSFVAENTRLATTFGQDAINILINRFNIVPWLVVAAISLALVTRADISTAKLKAEIKTLIFLSTLFLAILLGVYWIAVSQYGLQNVFYWQQTFVAFILWDYVYNSTLPEETVQTDKTLPHSQWKTFVYYSSLILLVLLSTILLSYLH